jgi:glycyl-tRNA synthetase beta chain
MTAMTTADILFEIGSEELPPGSLLKLAQSLAAGFAQGLEKQRLQHGAIEAFATPRRLALRIRACQTRQADHEMERRGPALAAAYDAAGKPTSATLGFARSCNVNPQDLIRVETDKGAWLCHKQHQPGQTSRSLLPEIAAQALAQLPVTKRMRWGNQDFQFIRPVHWLVFLEDSEVIPCQLLGLEAGNQSHGHRFHHPEAIRLHNPAEYEAQLLAAKVMVDFAQRREHIRQQVEAAAASLGATADLDPALLDEVTAITEWPRALVGGFEAGFLEVPNEVLILSMKKNQKYFPLFDASGQLLPHFITLANIQSPTPEKIIAGNERVIKPRLTDAAFFWKQDGKKTLAERLPELDKLVFQKDLGSIGDKCRRIARLAQTIAKDVRADMTLLERAALLCRADLVSHTVFEFPELQGVIGRYQALRDGEHPQLAQAMEEVYWPRFASDQLPQSALGQCLALADRLDSLIGIFGIGQKPTGDKDPYGLRRAAIGIIRILSEHQVALDLSEGIRQGIAIYGFENPGLHDQLYSFILERYRALRLEQGQATEVVTAVLALRPTRIPDMDLRIRALGDFVAMPGMADLIEGNKRIRNLLAKASADDKAGASSCNEQLFQSDTERELYRLAQTIKTQIDSAIADQNYLSGLKHLASLKAPLATFFEQTMVMDPDLDIRRNRLKLLAMLEDLFLRFADVSQL